MSGVREIVYKSCALPISLVMCGLYMETVCVLVYMSTYQTMTTITYDVPLY